MASIIRELQKLAADSAELHDFLKSLNGLLRQKDTRISKFLEVPVPETIESAPAPAPPKIKTPSPSPSHNSKGTVEEQSGNDDDDSPKEISRQNSITRRATELAEKNPVIVPRRRKRH